MSYHVIVKQGNLLEESADFIVNASNTKLILGSGVSMAFKRHCGLQLQKEMDLHLGKNQLKQGEVVLTTSAKAKNFKYALHVAVRNYSTPKNKNPTLKTIEKALKNIESYLLKDFQANAKSIKIALPLLGCGVGGLDKEKVIRLYKSFFSKNVDMDCKVVIYGYSKEDYEIIQTVVNEC